jgi:hypothetical protein
MNFAYNQKMEVEGGKPPGMEIEFALPETKIRPDVRIAMVKDPDGNIVEFVERS